MRMSRITKLVHEGFTRDEATQLSMVRKALSNYMVSGLRRKRISEVREELANMIKDHNRDPSHFTFLKGYSVYEAKYVNKESKGFLAAATRIREYYREHVDEQIFDLNEEARKLYREGILKREPRYKYAIPQIEQRM